jgi:Domain of unknown function (DUF4476)
MKKILLLALATTLSNVISAQSNLSFFTEDGQRFYVILNGETQNKSPLTKVNVTELKAANYKLLIKFEEDSLGTVTRYLPIEPYQEYVFALVRKKDKGASATIRKMGRQVQRDIETNEINNEQKVDGKAINKYKLRFVSQNVMKAYTPPPPPPPQNVQQPHHAPANSGAAQQTTVTQTTHTTTPVSVNVNGVNADVHYEESTTVTTTTTGAVAEEHYVMPGYGGPVGCNWPMSDQDFANAKHSISSKDFEDSKMTIAKQVVSANCLFASQVKELMLLFDFEDSKLEFAKYAYGYTYDTGNYFKVNDAFEFESSIEELNQYIGSH